VSGEIDWQAIQQELNQWQEFRIHIDEGVRHLSSAWHASEHARHLERTDRARWIEEWKVVYEKARDEAVTDGERRVYERVIETLRAAA
jgi:hypothetical protein